MSRDPERIIPLTVALMEVWQRYPDTRFCQLVSNIVASTGKDPFYVEDDEFMERLKVFKEEQDRFLRSRQ